ncbi:MAG: TlpA family protein disulfide reductase [Burkholderiales bacterium]
MSPRLRWASYAGAALLAVAAGVGTQLWRQSGGAAPEAAVAALRATRLPDLAGTPRAIDDWRGKVVVVNYWATWCVPCREEMPIFVKMQRKYGERGLIFVGIAIDQPAKVSTFAKELGIDYPILIGGVADIEATKAIGNKVSALPFTLIFDREGRLMKRQLGSIKEADLETIVSELL